MSWPITLKVWVLKNKKLVAMCEVCHGSKKNFRTVGPCDGALPKNAKLISTRETQDGVEADYWVPCDACDARGYQYVEVKVEDYETGVPVGLDGKFTLVNEKAQA